MADGPAPDVRLRDFVHGDGAHDPGLDAGFLESVLEGQGVHDGCQHADVVAGGAIHPASGSGQPAKDVPATDHDPDLDAGAVDLGYLGGDEGAEVGSDAVLATAEESLPGQLQQDPVVDRTIRSFRGRLGFA